ncbi:GNAT family N-acetyltransferase [Viridibacterium curvum]|uniref:N-acetyltransferase domain-containing protein n=1 Tax=Viridibacterium curvum TaxID=1101404 RepID=A0ABP9R0J4_9RHOO
MSAEPDWGEGEGFVPDDAPWTDEDFVTRDFRREDAPGLIALFRAAVLETAAAHYDAAQCAAWAAAADDETRFTQALVDGWVRVAEDSAGLIGFAQMDLPGELSMLYTAPRAARCSVATALLEDMMPLAEAMGAAQIDAHASAMARPLLERFGFKTVAEESVVRNGATLTRWHMQRSVHPAGSGKSRKKR